MLLMQIRCLLPDLGEGDFDKVADVKSSLCLRACHDVRLHNVARIPREYLGKEIARSART